MTVETPTRRGKRTMAGTLRLAGTRYLSAGAYLDERFRETVVDEVCRDPHRAVPPSFGFDLATVVRHCLRARRLVLLRDALLALLIVVGLWRATVPTVGWILLGLLFGVGTGLESLRRRVPRRMVVQLIGSAIVLVLAWFAVTNRALLAQLFSDPGAVFHALRDFLRALVLSWPTWLALASFAVVVGFRLATYQVLARLATDAGRPPAAPGEFLGRRLEYVSDAQWGNIIVHGGRWPFLGAGSLVDAWSLALELHRADAAGPGEPVSIDPVEAHEYLRQRLVATHADPALRDGERILGLVVQPRVIARGERRIDDVLLDDERGLVVPRFHADDELIQHLVRRPQGGLRMYQQVTVETADWGQNTADDPWTGIDTEQDVSVSAFVYLAVEGSMLYVECVSTQLPAIRPAFRVVDDFAALDGGQLLWRALGNSVGPFPRDCALALVHAVTRVASVFRVDRRLGRAEAEPLGRVAYNYGARLSVREQAAAPPGEQTFLQRLDAEKYAKLIELRVSTALLEFLRDKGVHTGEYEARVSVVYNEGVMITGGTVTGAVATGSAATAYATVPPPTTT